MREFPNEQAKFYYNLGKSDGKTEVIEDYKEKLLQRLIPHLKDLECAKCSETYLAITEIANELTERK